MVHLVLKFTFFVAFSLGQPSGAARDPEYMLLDYDQEGRWKENSLKMGPLMCILQWAEKYLPSEELKPYQPRANYASDTPVALESTQSELQWIRDMNLVQMQGVGIPAILRSQGVRKSCEASISRDLCHFQYFPHGTSTASLVLFRMKTTASTC